MTAIFESILPVFLLLLSGTVLRRLPLMDAAGWAGLEQLGYWFLYPALLFLTILGADFTGVALDAMIGSLLATVLLMIGLTLAIWPLLRDSGAARASEYSSIFQTAVRWNGFIALAVAQKIYPGPGMAVVALAMAAIIIPINVASVYVVTTFADRSANWGSIARAMATNPLIIASMAAVLLRLTPFGLYEPIEETLRLVGSAALGMGLLAIGAALRVEDLIRPRLTSLVPTAIKLVLFPIAIVAVGLAFGVRGEPLSYLALCAAVPTAMNGYLLARRLGGDAELYAVTTTLQTFVSFFTIPLVLALTAQVAG